MYLEDAKFEELENLKIIKTKHINPGPAFWGDRVEKIRIVTDSSVFYLETGGGGVNLFGFPGSQSHGVWLYRLKKGKKPIG